jgi:alpha-N-arabinofuranosidase
MLSADEWNVWYRTRDRATRTRPGWPVAPAILEELFTMEDTLVFAGALIQLLNRCDRVKIACVAQLVNVIAPIMTETGGRAWRQPIFFPFAQASRWGRGRVLQSCVQSTEFATPAGRRFPHLLVSAVHHPGDSSLVLFCLNRDLAEPSSVRLDCRGFEPRGVIESATLRHEDLDVTNTADQPDAVRPGPGPEVRVAQECSFNLPPASWTMIRLELGR